ncbi:MAG: hypothetical protein LBU32_33065 [Clostridiales bacterium]|jgi:hypothetical protein|nr:hypothetical protein [Clostridiales bacterium]
MTINELHDAVKRFFFGKAERLSVSPSYRRVSCVIYESFRLECFLSNSGDKFRARLWVAPFAHVDSFLGKSISETAKPEEVKQSLKTIDSYCRLRLPEKFLAPYDKQSRMVSKLDGNARWRALVLEPAGAVAQKNIGDAIVAIEINQLYAIAKGFFGVRAEQWKIDEKRMCIEFILYDTYLVHCGIEPQTGMFSARIVMGEKFASSAFMGKLLPLSADEASVRQSLKIIDEQCRLRLPDKFLVAFELYKRTKS